MIKVWVYDNCFVSRVIDGDTIVVDIDLGMKLCMHGVTVRLKDIDTPETRKLKDVSELEIKAGKLVKSYVEKLLLFDDKTRYISIISKTLDKYGRLESDIIIEHNNKRVNLNQYLVDEGLAIVYDNNKWTDIKLQSIINKFK